MPDLLIEGVNLNSQRNYWFNPSHEYVVFDKIEFIESWRRNLYYLFALMIQEG